MCVQLCPSLSEKRNESLVLLLVGQVVEMVRSSGSSVTFHVLSADSYKLAKEMGVSLSGTNTSSRPVGAHNQVPKAKLCYLIKSGPTFGFSLKSVKGET